MNDDLNISQLEAKALDIINAGAGITDEQLQALAADEALRREVAELQQMGAYVRQQGQPVDVDARLQQFKARHQKRQTRRATVKYIRYALAAAAVAFVAFLSVEALLGRHDGPGTAGSSQETRVVFSTEGKQSGVSLTTENGEQVVLSAQTRQNTSLTLEDFRRVFSQKENVEAVTLSVPVGKSADITLPDGSVAYLHPGSKVMFPTTFVGDKRVVQLEGDAYFKVAKDAAHPFVVMAGQLQTTVLGTEFHVSSSHAEVVLVSGSVSVAVGGQTETRLEPGQQLTLSNDGRTPTITEVDTEPYKYWRDGYLYFDNVELKDIMEAVGANFNMTVEFRNTEALHYRMRFITERNNGIDAAISMMNRMKKVTVHRNGNQIFVD